MNYCSLDDAFPTTEGVPSPGCMAEQAAKQARKEERRKMKRCKVDPDRQQYGPLPDVPAMNIGTGLREHVPATAPQGEMDSDSWTKVDPFEPMLPLPQAATSSVGFDSSQPSQPKKKSYFGADMEDSYADYVPDQKDYQLQPDFLASFEQTGLQKASALPPPSSNMYWKPNGKSGAQTSFIESVPQQKYHGTNDVSMQEVMKRMDMLFAKLDDLNATSPEQLTSELLMFISSGVFVLFMMDLLVKKGSKMRF
jgi:hypothetical protein